MWAPPSAPQQQHSVVKWARLAAYLLLDCIPAELSLAALHTLLSPLYYSTRAARASSSRRSGRSAAPVLSPPEHSTLCAPALDSRRATGLSASVQYSGRYGAQLLPHLPSTLPAPLLYDCRSCTLTLQPLYSCSASPLRTLLRLYTRLSPFQH